MHHLLSLISCLVWGKEWNGLYPSLPPYSQAHVRLIIRNGFIPPKFMGWSHGGPFHFRWGDSSNQRTYCILMWSLNLWLSCALGPGNLFRSWNYFIIAFTCQSIGCFLLYIKIWICPLRGWIASLTFSSGKCIWQRPYVLSVFLINWTLCNWRCVTTFKFTVSLCFLVNWAKT